MAFSTNLRPNASSDPSALKTEIVELFSSYRKVCVAFKFFGKYGSIFVSENKCF